MGGMIVYRAAHTPIRSYRYTVAMFPLPYKTVLKYRTGQNVGGISILASNTKCTRECRPHFAACGTPDRAIGFLSLKLRVSRLKQRSHAH
jgi:hypothetical protein